jgi:hypothetical protein
MPSLSGCRQPFWAATCDENSSKIHVHQASHELLHVGVPDIDVGFNKVRNGPGDVSEVDLSELVHFCERSGGFEDVLVHELAAFHSGAAAEAHADIRLFAISSAPIYLEIAEMQRGTLPSSGTGGSSGWIPIRTLVSSATGPPASGRSAPGGRRRRTPDAVPICAQVVHRCRLSRDSGGIVCTVRSSCRDRQVQRNLWPVVNIRVTDLGNL